MTKANLKKAKAALAKGTPIPKLTRELGLKEKPREVREALFKEYGEDTIRTILREKVWGQQRGNPANRPITAGVLKQQAKRLLAQTKTAAELDEHVAMYFQLIADVREKKATLV